MAKATTETVTVATITTVTLTLSKEEAETLHHIVLRIGGDARTSRRRHADAIFGAIAGAGVSAGPNDSTGGIYFN